MSPALRIAIPVDDDDGFLNDAIGTNYNWTSNSENRSFWMDDSTS